MSTLFNGTLINSKSINYIRYGNNIFENMCLNKHIYSKLYFVYNNTKINNSFFLEIKLHCSAQCLNLKLIFNKNL